MLFAADACEETGGRLKRTLERRTEIDLAVVVSDVSVIGLSVVFRPV